MTSSRETKRFLNNAIIKDISDAVGLLHYGEVNIKVHDRKIIQIEIAERKRFDDVWKIEGGGGI